MTRTSRKAGVAAEPKPRGQSNRRPPQSTPGPAATAGSLEDTIRFRAYEIYAGRNGGPGDALSDWLQAEREVTARAALRG